MSEAPALGAGMAILELGLIVAGLAASLVALASMIWLVVVAFQTHVGWGLGVWFCYPFGAFAFMAGHWRRARLPALAHLLAMLLALVALGVLEVVDPPLPEQDPAAAASPAPRD